MKRMKVLSAALALTAVLGMAGVASAKGAKGAKTGKHHGVSGKITDISGNNQFTLTTGGKKNPQTLTVTVTGTTQYTVEGKSGSFSDLKKGDRVTVEPDATNPSRIVDKGPKQHKKAQ